MIVYFPTLLFSGKDYLSRNFKRVAEVWMVNKIDNALNIFLGNLLTFLG